MLSGDSRLLRLVASNTGFRKTALPSVSCRQNGYWYLSWNTRSYCNSCLYIDSIILQYTHTLAKVEFLCSGTNRTTLLCVLPINTLPLVLQEASDFITGRHLILALHKPSILRLTAPRDVSFSDSLLFIHSNNDIRNTRNPIATS